MDSIPVTQDYRDEPECVVGSIFSTHELVQMFESGYIFEIAPQIECDGVDDNGEYINPRLLSVSIITHTARKVDNA